MDGWVGKWVRVKMNACMFVWIDAWMDACMFVWMDTWMHRWMDGRMNIHGCTYGSMHVCVYARMYRRMWDIPFTVCWWYNTRTDFADSEPGIFDLFIGLSACKHTLLNGLTLQIGPNGHCSWSSVDRPCRLVSVISHVKPTHKWKGIILTRHTHVILFWLSSTHDAHIKLQKSAAHQKAVIKIYILKIIFENIAHGIGNSYICGICLRHNTFLQSGCYVSNRADMSVCVWKHMKNHHETNIART